MNINIDYVFKEVCLYPKRNNTLRMNSSDCVIGKSILSHSKETVYGLLREGLHLQESNLFEKY